MSARQPVGRQGRGARRAVAMTVIVGAAAGAVLMTGPVPWPQQDRDWLFVP